MTRQKSIVLDLGTPLVLLPQTYGPFALERNRATAANIVRRSTLAWARDAASFERLRELAGGSEPGERFRLSVDLAFGLPSRRPIDLQDDVAHWIDSGAQIFGVNISGLLANDSGSAQEFGLADDYATVMTEMLGRLLDSTSAKVMLVPHVRSDLWVVESDIAACRRLGEQLAATHPDRVAVLEGVDRAQEVKWVIGQCSAFCGTRMHSVIAALSSTVPAIALAYSLKTAGVLESCGQGERVVDLRDQPSAAVTESAVALWEQRDEVREQLTAAMPGVREASSRPFADIAAMIESRREGVRL